MKSRTFEIMYLKTSNFGRSSNVYKYFEINSQEVEETNGPSNCEKTNKVLNLTTVEFKGRIIIENLVEVFKVSSSDFLASKILNIFLLLVLIPMNISQVQI